MNHKNAQIRYRALRSLAIFEPKNWINNVAPLVSDNVRAVHIAAVDLFVELPKDLIPSQYLAAFEIAQNELVSYLYYQTDFKVGNLRLADYFKNLKKGIAISPDAPDLYYALTFVYIQSDNKTKAQQTALLLKQLDPNNPNYQELFRNLGLQ